MNNRVLAIGLRSTFLASAAIALPTPLVAQTARAFHFDMPAQPMAGALRQIARQTGAQIMFSPDDVSGLSAPRMQGDLGVEEAVRRLVAGTDLIAEKSASAIIIRRGRKTAAAESEQEYVLPSDIVITGSRISGVPVASSIISIKREDMRNAGQSTLGEVVRGIPQSFGGGQNPGVGYNVPAAGGVDVGGGSSINLRGLGSDATLTLLNGHRLSYSSSRQSVDVSAIPLDAVDRIEIVADGASALYGSDAVAGVANIILRHDLNGLETSANIGRSTDGGNFSQRYGAIAGERWSNGGVFAAYEFARSTAIDANQRSYAVRRSPGLTLFPALKHHNAIISGYQQLTSNVSFDLDALYNVRWSESTFPLNATGNLGVSRADSASEAQSWLLAPSVRYSTGTWELFLTGSYGDDRVDYATRTTVSGKTSNAGNGRYTNGVSAIEVGGNGSLLSLPAGAAKLAIGTGFRSNRLTSYKGLGSFQNFTQSQSSYYGYAEINIPIVSPEQDVPRLYRVNVSGALRYESYPGVGAITTPKLGIIVGLSRDIDMKASWGRSFRAPTLLQRYQPDSVALARATSFGGLGLPAGSTALYLSGGNGNLLPERARSWSGTVAFHPAALPRLRAELGYFETRYVDRIVSPISLTSVALSNPIYADQITRYPSSTEQAAIIASAGTFINAAGAAYDPSKVVAIIRNNNVNAGRQTLHGVDGQMTYKLLATETGDALSIFVNATYLVSKQQLSASQPIVVLAGTLFNPPHVRARGGLTWKHKAFRVTTIANYVGPLDDIRKTPPLGLASTATFDFSVGYRTGDRSGPLKGLEIGLSVLNAFNTKPPMIATSLYTDTPYDSTNYNPIGRYISLSVSKSW
ncbi:iron complex outermembrane receptor protein [Sphingomonas sp. SORGH_AS 950]|uniref:TonB-dependent receptor n=1 Tax=Sphingomonas sp. SORGH_AS_0950 TaxID=3041792 RepID=UPI002786A4AD|nr:TonB-dependent receptor [Sphingomonas sp. SORGH_AS_0950]MDQ1158935.1 iron complex outermembrane receptor protein [Sphingomonas sp. SORGH_AS_0950]